MKTIEEIENYIEEQDQNGALLVTGKWGSGKTYLIRQIEKKLNQEPKNLMAVVSLFGIEDTNTLSKKVKEQLSNSFFLEGDSCSMNMTRSFLQQ